jgi:3-isopropylmalate/(R)-2-methylmalate dehydratase small subunit
MERFIRVEGAAVAMPGANIDTDVIMPKVFLKGIDRSGLARGLFHDLRFDEAGAPRAGFVLNQLKSPATFLVVGPNFGCGSSREHAVWGMLQYGVRALIGTSFAGIFADNAANNGLLLVTLPEAEIAPLMALAENGSVNLCIDLERSVIRAGDKDIAFEIDGARRQALMSGLDRIGETLAHADDIRAFQQAYFAAAPWLVERTAE